MRSALMFWSSLFCGRCQAAELYKWVDDKGVVNFTDDYNKVPPAYRNRLSWKAEKWSPSRTFRCRCFLGTSSCSCQKPAVAGQAPGPQGQTDRYASVRPTGKTRRGHEGKASGGKPEYDEANKRYQEKSDESARAIREPRNTK